MSEASSQKSETDKKRKKTEKKPNSLHNLLDDNKERKCKTHTSRKSKKSINDKNSFTDIRKNFRKFKNYFNDLRIAYIDEFQKLETGKEKDIFTLKKEFEKKMPYISGKKNINSSSIQIPDKKIFMKKIFIEIINSFNENNDYPGEKKCGLAYLDNSEWIYYTIEEVFYQRYITDTKKIMSKLYDDFMQNEIKTDTLFTENDNYILPSSDTGYNSERNEIKFFEMKTGLTSSPDLIIKLDPEKDTISINPKNNCTFDQYFKSISYNYIEIDGALVNDTKKDIIIKNKDNAMISYKKILVNSQEQKKGDKKDYIYTTHLSDKSDDITVPAETLIIFQTKIKSPYINLDSKDLEKFNTKEIIFKNMKKELAVVLKKMIQQGNYFWNLYNKINLIKKDYNLVFFFLYLIIFLLLI